MMYHPALKARPVRIGSSELYTSDRKEELLGRVNEPTIDGITADGHGDQLVLTLMYGMTPGLLRVAKLGSSWIVLSLAQF